MTAVAGVAGGLPPNTLDADLDEVTSLLALPNIEADEDDDDDCVVVVVEKILKVF